MRWKEGWTNKVKPPAWGFTAVESSSHQSFIQSPVIKSIRLSRILRPNPAGESPIYSRAPNSGLIAMLCQKDTNLLSTQKLGNTGQRLRLNSACLPIHLAHHRHHVNYKSALFPSLKPPQKTFACSSSPHRWLVKSCCLCKFLLKHALILFFLVVPTN